MNKTNLKKALFWWWVLGVLAGVVASLLVGHSVVAEPLLSGISYFIFYWWFVLYWKDK